MRTRKFRAYNERLKRWEYAERVDEFASFFEKINAGLLNINTLGDYVCLKDKNGKKIHEGDVVLVDRKEWEVVYFRGNTCIKRKTVNGNIQLRLLKSIKEIVKQPMISIIGNIRENPELLTDEP